VEAILLVGAACVAAVLLQAGLSKLVRPDGLRRALAELGLPLATTGTVRAFAVVECVAGAALLTAATRPAGAVLVVVTGTAITGLGLVGAVRHVVEPCGCFGGAHGRPLGLSNAALGAALVTGGAAVFVATPPTGTAAVLATALALLLLCVPVHRGWAWPLIRPARSARPDRLPVAPPEGLPS
jgi:hypothetical protein